VRGATTVRMLDGGRVKGRPKPFPTFDYINKDRGSVVKEGSTSMGIPAELGVNNEMLLPKKKEKASGDE